MERRAILIAIIGWLTFTFVFLALQGIAPQSHRGSSWPPGVIEQALSHSPTYREILRLSDRPEFYVEDRSSAFLELAIGCDVEVSEELHRFDRWATLRVFRDGAITKLGYDKNMEYQWESEYRP